MTFLLSFFTFNSLNLELLAYNIEPPLKNFRDGSKSVSISRDQKVKEIQEEITNNWPEGIITYYLEDKSYDSSVGVLIRAAMSELESSACIRFRAAKEKPDGNITWLHITNPNRKRECVHDAEVLKGGEIRLVLGYDCLKPKDLLHSLLHGIGFKDEVTHPHRDNYIKVVWENIQPAYRHLYRTQSVDISRSIVEYDPLSIMHFHDRAFSINGKATVLPLETGLNISPSDSLSQLDKMKLHIYFGHECNKRKFSSLMETCKMSLKGEKQPAKNQNGDKKKQPESKNSEENVVSDKDISKINKNSSEDNDEQQVHEDDDVNEDKEEENQESQQTTGEIDENKMKEKSNGKEISQDQQNSDDDVTIGSAEGKDDKSPQLLVAVAQVSSESIGNKNDLEDSSYEKDKQNSEINLNNYSNDDQ